MNNIVIGYHYRAESKRSNSVSRIHTYPEKFALSTDSRGDFHVGKLLLVCLIRLKFMAVKLEGIRAWLSSIGKKSVC